MIRSKDALSGILFVGLGLFVTMFAASLRLGTLSAMGPGFYPLTLGGLSIVIGLLFLGKFFIDRIRNSQISVVDAIHLKPLAIMSAAFLVFSLMSTRLGLFISIILVVILSRLASNEEIVWWKLSIYAVGMSVFTAALFRYGLGLPLQIWP